jgi:hypothetical protein
MIEEPSAFGNVDQRACCAEAGTAHSPDRHVRQAGGLHALADLVEDEVRLHRQAA